MIRCSILLPRETDRTSVRDLVAFLRAMDVRPIICYGDTDGPCVDCVPMETTQAVAQAVADHLA